MTNKAEISSLLCDFIRFIQHYLLLAIILNTSSKTGETK
jgi:hypothetical protein